METTSRTITTPRGTFRIHTVFDSYDAARAAGWSFWFHHWDGDGKLVGILVMNNRTGAIVESTLNQ